MEQDKRNSVYRGLEERMDQKKTADGLRDEDKRQGDLQDSDSGRELPEGLERERKGPLNPSSGRKPPEK
jgi:hypothetical protein